MSLALVFALATLSIPLVNQIAKVNEYTDRNAGLLVAQKEKHLQRQSKRHRLLRARVLHRYKKWKGNVDDAAEGKEPIIPEDMEMQGYEEAMDGAIDNSRERQKLFAMRLFGFTIDTGVL